MKECNEQIVGKMAELLGEVLPAERDEVVVRAKNLITGKEKRAKEEQLRELFDSQIKTLKDRGCPPAIMKMLVAQREKVIIHAGPITFDEGRIPFLPVIPTTYLTIYSQIAMVRKGDVLGCVFITCEDIKDVIVTPGRPYYIYNIEDGEAMLGMVVKDASKLIRKQKRSCLTAVEIISLGIHTDVLSGHFVDAPGSCFGSSAYVISLWLKGNCPTLEWSQVDSYSERWGVASCDRY